MAVLETDARALREVAANIVRVGVTLFVQKGKFGRSVYLTLAVAPATPVARKRSQFFALCPFDNHSFRSTGNPPYM